ncbi:MAG: hypothetical protein ABI580_04115, partial [Burkholderiaceae bacterium]
YNAQFTDDAGSPGPVFRYKQIFSLGREMNAYSASLIYTHASSYRDSKANIQPPLTTIQSAAMGSSTCRSPIGASRADAAGRYSERARRGSAVHQPERALPGAALQQQLVVLAEYDTAGHTSSLQAKKS